MGRDEGAGLMPGTQHIPALATHQRRRSLGYTRGTMRVNSFEIQDLIGNFTAQLMEAVTAQTGRRIQGIVAAALSGSGSAAPLSIGNIGVFRQASKARRLSGKATAARKLQGRYIGALRSLRPADRARVKKMASQEGVGAAVKLALTLK